MVRSLRMLLEQVLAQSRLCSFPNRRHSKGVNRTISTRAFSEPSQADGKVQQKKAGNPSFVAQKAAQILKFLVFRNSISHGKPSFAGVLGFLCLLYLSFAGGGSWMFDKGAVALFCLCNSPLLHFSRDCGVPKV